MDSMNSLLDKFSTVEVKPDANISDVDKAFCQTQQAAYHAACAALEAMADEAAKYTNEQKEIVGEDGNGFLYIDGFNPQEYIDEISKLHHRFIVRLVEHFSRTYHVELSSDQAADNLIPKKPEDPDRPFRGFGYQEWTDKEMEEWKKRQQAYKEAVEEHTSTLRALRLTYEQVVEQIVTQLDGFTFQDKALNELKEAAHRGAWNRYHHKKEYEQKKAVISFSDYACHWDTWYSSPHIELSDGMKNVIRALGYYELGQIGVCERYHGFGDLLGWKFEVQEIEFGDMYEKVKSVKAFKNGRVDIRFTKESYAREFVEQFLGLEE